MRFELEVVSDDILPAVRSLMASRLSREYGYTQEEIAHKLSVTQPAVSQYLAGSRAEKSVKEKLEDDPQIRVLVEEASGKAARDENFSKEIARIVETVRDKGLLKERFQDTETLNP